MGNIQDHLERQVRTDELKEKLKDPYATFHDEEESATKQDDVLKSALAKNADQKGSAETPPSADKK